ncbi:MAG: hypothetical protein WD533_03475 [Dehalococcoidia bacterium]
MVDLTAQTSWVLLVTWTLSVLYELYRAMFKSSVSEFDSFRSWLGQGLPLLFILGFATALLVATGWTWAVWLTLVFVVAVIGISIFYYSPVILPARKPGPLDHFEDKVFTGLLFVAAALLLYQVTGTALAA